MNATSTAGFGNVGEGDALEDGRMECGVCWAIYDPAEGDPIWQIPPDTPFSRLPPEWRCPSCDAEQIKFMCLAGRGEPLP